MSPNNASLDSELVQRFVSDAHRDIDSVKDMVEKEPALVNACWDWGGGDWETGLGAAAHTGSKDIAEYLLQKGARIDLYAAAMLGKLSVVQAILDDNPSEKDKPGPHGISLLAHARNGGKEAAEVVKLLRSLNKKIKAKGEITNCRGPGIPILRNATARGTSGTRNAYGNWRRIFRNSMWTLRVSQSWIGTVGLVKAELRRSGKSPRTAGGSMRSIPGYP